MIIMDLDDMHFHIAGNEAASFATQVAANNYLERRTRSWNWVWTLSIGALVISGIGGTIAWVRWKATK